MKAEMVRAVLDGRKTQTRRIIATDNRPQSPDSFMRGLSPNPMNVRWLGTYLKCDAPNGSLSVSYRIPCPYGNSIEEDRLWVRETFHHGDAWYDERPGMEWKNCHRDGKCTWVDYAATFDPKKGERDFAWTPSIFMPRWASRITLEITGIRVEHVQDISEADAEAEGIQFIREAPDCDETLTARDLFEVLWDSINEKCGFGWDANPWVWVIEFRRTT
jgi:hypothetical protein